MYKNNSQALRPLRNARSTKEIWEGNSKVLGKKRLPLLATHSRGLELSPSDYDLISSPIWPSNLETLAICRLLALATEITLGIKLK